MGSTAAKKKAKIGFDYVHSMVDDHTRLAYSEIHDDEQGDTCAGFIEGAAAFFAGHGISIERVMTDNHWSYKKSNTVAKVIAEPRRPHASAALGRWVADQGNRCRQQRSDLKGHWRAYFRMTMTVDGDPSIGEQAQRQ